LYVCVGSNVTGTADVAVTVNELVCATTPYVSTTCTIMPVFVWSVVGVPPNVTVVPAREAVIHDGLFTTFKVYGVCPFATVRVALYAEPVVTVVAGVPVSVIAATGVTPGVVVTVALPCELVAFTSHVIAVSPVWYVYSWLVAPEITTPDFFH
jgi:hypothetical protein